MSWGIKFSISTEHLDKVLENIFLLWRWFAEIGNALLEAMVLFYMYSILIGTYCKLTYMYSFLSGNKCYGKQIHVYSNVSGNKWRGKLNSRVYSTCD